MANEVTDRQSLMRRPAAVTKTDRDIAHAMAERYYVMQQAMEEWDDMPDPVVVALLTAAAWGER